MIKLIRLRKARNLLISFGGQDAAIFSDGVLRNTRIEHGAAGQSGRRGRESRPQAYNTEARETKETRMPRHALQLVLIGALLLPFARTADAQVLRACALERQEFCSTVPTGGGQVVRCLRANAAQASGMCVQALQSRPGAMRASPVAMQGGPAAMQGGPGTPSSYSNGPGMAATPPAYGAPATPRPGRRIMQACAMERQQFCGAVQAGGGRVMACLHENVAQASPRCGRVLQAGLGARALGGRPAAYGPAPGVTPTGAYGAAPAPGLPPAQQQ
jgi:hypothetical protein